MGVRKMVTVRTEFLPASEFKSEFAKFVFGDKLNTDISKITDPEVRGWKNKIKKLELEKEPLQFAEVFDIWRACFHATQFIDGSRDVLDSLTPF